MNTWWVVAGVFALASACVAAGLFLGAILQTGRVGRLKDDLDHAVADNTRLTETICLYRGRLKVDSLAELRELQDQLQRDRAVCGEYETEFTSRSRRRGDHQ